MAVVCNLKPKIIALTEIIAAKKQNKTKTKQKQNKTKQNKTKQKQKKQKHQKECNKFEYSIPG